MYCGEMINSISIKSAKDYCRYKELIDRIIDNAEKITGYRATYKELDGLLWYYFKGEDSRIKEAANCIRKLKGDKK